MGGAMVRNLVKAGHRVSAWNRDPAATASLDGVTVLESPATAFENEAVITMLSDDAAVRSVIIDSDALSKARRGCVHVVMSTISPALVEELQDIHHRARVGFVSATVFGIPAVAEKGELNILAAGDPRAVLTVQPLFEVLGQETWHLGIDPKHANVAKIAGNLMITLAIEAMGEATALTESYGLSAEDFLNVLTNTNFACPAYKRYGGNIAHKSYDPGFKLTLGLKDVNLAIDAAKAKRAELPSAELVRQSMIRAVDRGLGDKDWSAFAEMTRR
jgi:3-hydroxyisobutyrate dehydrogenase-like beta-hydroxyacid dehydrogenase